MLVVQQDCKYGIQTAHPSAWPATMPGLVLICDCAAEAAVSCCAARLKSPFAHNPLEMRTALLWMRQLGAGSAASHKRRVVTMLSTNKCAWHKLTRSQKFVEAWCSCRRHAMRSSKMPHAWPQVHVWHVVCMESTPSQAESWGECCPTSSTWSMMGSCVCFSSASQYTRSKRYVHMW